MALIPPSPVGSPFTSYTWADWYEKVRRAINDSATISWSQITTFDSGTPLPIAFGGSGTATPALVAGANIGLTNPWPNTTIAFSGILPIANGGTATATPALVAGTGIAITGTWPANTIAQSPGPAFGAYQSAAAQTLLASTITKITLDVEEFDTDNCFTGSKFTPTRAGYYQFDGAVYATICGNFVVAYIYKNGALYKIGSFAAATGGQGASQVSSVIAMNGSTDYIELYGITQAAGTINNSAPATYLNGTWIRGL